MAVIRHFSINLARQADDLPIQYLGFGALTRRGSNRGELVQSGFVPTADQDISLTHSISMSFNPASCISSITAWRDQ